MSTDRPWLDASLPFRRRAELLVGAMSLEEKLPQFVHSAPAIERLGVPAYNWWNECLHGVARAGRATVFPQAIGLAATFNVPLVSEIFTAISDEARAKHHQALRQNNHGMYFGLTYWTPNINIFRDPRWGRGQETYGEDPYLTSRMGVAIVKAIQGDDPTYLKLVATPKHFAVHSGPEADRHTFNATCSPRDLHETYLHAFKATVTEAHAWSVMGAYNRTNGEPCCGSKTLLADILRGEWNFPGYVVSDCWAICDFHKNHKITATGSESVAMALKGGCDLICGVGLDYLRSAVQAGLLTEADLDVPLTRLFEARFKLGMFDPPEAVAYARISPEVVGCKAHQELALRAARESLVLLKNEGHVLPLSRTIRKLLVVGPTAADLPVLLGNYNGHAAKLTTILEGIVGQVSLGTDVTYTPGCHIIDSKQSLSGDIEWHKDADAIVAVVGFSAQLEGEEGCVYGDADFLVAGDRLKIGLPGRQLELLQKLASFGKPLIAVITGGSPIELEWVRQNVPAMLLAWYPGQEGGRAVAEALFGDYSPAGRLPLTFPQSLAQLPAFDNYALAGRTYRFMTAEPAFAFGFGLSYATFAYSQLKVSPKRPAGGQPIRIAVTVTNTGSCTSDEVAQLYISHVSAPVPTPIRQLAGFQRLALKPGQSKTVRFTITPDQLRCYGDDGKPFFAPGDFRVAIGGGQPLPGTTYVDTVIGIRA